MKSKHGYLRTQQVESITSIDMSIIFSKRVRRLAIPTYAGNGSEDSRIEGNGFICPLESCPLSNCM